MLKKPKTQQKNLSATAKTTLMIQAVNLGLLLFTFQVLLRAVISSFSLQSLSAALIMFLEGNSST